MNPYLRVWYAMVLGFATSIADARPPSCDAPELGGSMSESTYSVVERAVDHLSNDRFDEAERRLLGVIDRVKGYELAVVYQTLGFVYVQQDKLNEGLEAFEKALALNALPRQPREELMVNVGQIQLANRDFAAGIATLERYFAEACTTPSAEIHIALAMAYAESARYEPALQQVQIALTKAKSPSEQWLQLQLALQFELNLLQDCAKTLLQLISFSPARDEYWRQLSGVLMQIEEEQQALAVMAIAERQGHLQNERDLKNLANIYLMMDIPYKAGRLLEKGLSRGIIADNADNFEYLSDAWINAREWDSAESALRSAAASGRSGKLWTRLAQVLMEKEDWPGAKDALSQAIKSGVSDPGQTAYLLGVAAYYAGDPRTAEQALRDALKYPDTAEQARQWLDHLVQNGRSSAS